MNMPFNDRHRYLAMRRAMKLNKLFKEDTFDEIMNALNLPPSDPNREVNFRAACQRAQLVQEEIVWLWNYLKNCTKTGTGGWLGLPEAAATGW